ncbi:MAG: crossover junction endodeoxyribonuclease RuvC [Acidobacteriota bacterium]|nr:crossover junction endodeoxyribonuclease RuvC [Acidobacteriota bacterium]
MGVAVLDGDELVYYAVKIVRSKAKSFQELCACVESIIKRLVEEHRPAVLAIRQPLIIQQSAEALATVIREIKQAAQHEGLVVCEYAPKTVRRFICGSTKATKRQAAERLAARFGELHRYLEHRGKWEELYYSKLFEAVGVGLTCHFNTNRR